MKNVLRTVRIYGHLGARFGRVHQLCVSSAAEAVRALCSQLPGFERALTDSKDHYAVFYGKRNISKDQLRDPSGADDIRIAPMLAGAKKQGVLQTVAGIVLVVVGWIGVTYGQAFGGAVWGPALQRIGWGLIAGGVAQMLTSTPRGRSARDRSDNRPSYNFNGPLNTQAQGNPVPVLYGELIVGSAVVSAGIDVKAQAYIPAPGTTPVGGGGGGGGGASTYHLF